MAEGKKLWRLIKEVAKKRDVEPFKVYVFMPHEFDVSGELQDIAYEYSATYEHEEDLVERNHADKDCCGRCGKELGSRYRDMVIHLANAHGMCILPEPSNFDM